MPAVRLTESNIKYFKLRLMEFFPDIRSSMASEVIASFLGFRTNIALKTAVREDIDSYPTITHITDKVYYERKNKLGFPDITSRLLQDITYEAEFPDPLWMQVSQPNSPENTYWYHYCNVRNLPYVYVFENSDGFEVHYDGITIDSPYDSSIRGSEGEGIGNIIWNFIDAICKKGTSNWCYSGSSFVGYAERLSREEALLFADGVFQIQYSATQDVLVDA